jgi:hypothetical protein
MNQSPAPIATATRTLRPFGDHPAVAVGRSGRLGAVCADLGCPPLVIVPRIGEWRPELERWISAGVGIPVRIGQLHAESAPGERNLLPAFVPVIELRDVRLFDPRGQEALLLPQVNVAVSVTSLWRLGVDQIVIDHRCLTCGAPPKGGIEVAGLDVRR